MEFLLGSFLKKVAQTAAWGEGIVGQPDANACKANARQAERRRRVRPAFKLFRMRLVRCLPSSFLFFFHTFFTNP
jgi:hypothetical protein